MKKIIFMTPLLILLMISCSKEQVATKVETKKLIAVSGDAASIRHWLVTGNEQLLRRGVIWGNNQNLTLGTHQGLTTEGLHTGDQLSVIGGLTPGTAYYARAYAETSLTTYYGDVVAFTTTNGVSDSQGNIYKTVRIGQQEWMAENLRTTEYNQAEAIPYIVGDLKWYNNRIMAMNWYDHNITQWRLVYGGLYRGYTEPGKNICPQGWHVPSLTEWETLINHLGGLSVAGGMLKGSVSTPADHPRWNAPNTGANNYAFFNAYPGGRRAPDGVFQDMGTMAYFWTSTPFSTDQHYFISLRNNEKVVGVGPTLSFSGFSCRCMKNP